MDFRPTTEQEMFRASLRTWLEKNLSPISRKIDSDADGIPENITQGLADLGVFGLTIPEEYGGCAVPGEELIYGMIAIHELARADLSMSVADYALLPIGWSYIVNKYGSEQLKERVLPRAAKGTCFVGISATEPGGGSDLAATKTVALWNEEKHAYILNGEKAFISGITECAKWVRPAATAPW